MNPFLPILSHHFLIAAGAAFLLGISKAGIKGLSALVVTGFALVYGARESTGILMPLLLCGDIFAVLYYKRHVKWMYIKKLMPWMVFGVLIGVAGGQFVSETLFKNGMAVIILISVGSLFYWDKRKENSVPTHWSFGSTMGVLAGFTTMVGNLAGAFANIYFLAMRLPKNEFIGTAAWLFFCINVFKVPFHVFAWKTMTGHSLLQSFQLIPALLLGLLLGVGFVKQIKNDNYRKLILIFTALGGLVIFFQ